jgi:methionine-rich copper-binding protein CopC
MKYRFTINQAVSVGRWIPVLALLTACGDVGEISEGGAPHGTTPAVMTSTFESSAPENEAVLSVPPEKVTVSFTAPVLAGSEIVVWRNKAPVPTDAVEIAEDGLSASVAIHPPLPATGVYGVAYSAVSGAATESGLFVFYVELGEYQGQALTSLGEFRDNSIKGPTYVDTDDYELEITGLVKNPLRLTYAEVLEFASESRVMDMNCVEGWTVSPLWTGVPIMELIEAAEPQDGAVSLIFTAIDGYDDFLPISYVEEHDIMLAHTLNQVTLPAARGFPFQVAAEGKWGYKWVKWLKKIEVSNVETYEGFWEAYGYSVDGDLDKPFR